jgi:hypothetical protein
VTGRAVSEVAGVVAFAFSLCVAVYAWLAAGFNCDDVCNGPPGDWTGTKDAAQWSVMVALGIGTLVLSLALNAAAAVGRVGLAGAVAMLWAACAAGLAVLLTQAHGHGVTYLNLFLLGLASVAATALYAGGRHLSAGPGGGDWPR